MIGASTRGVISENSSGLFWDLRWVKVVDFTSNCMLFIFKQCLLSFPIKTKMKKLGRGWSNMIFDRSKLHKIESPDDLDRSRRSEIAFLDDFERFS